MYIEDMSIKWQHASSIDSAQYVAVLIFQRGFKTTVKNSSLKFMGIDRSNALINYAIFMIVCRLD